MAAVLPVRDPCQDEVIPRWNHRCIPKVCILTILALGDRSDRDLISIDDLFRVVVQCDGRVVIGIEVIPFDPEAGVCRDVLRGEILDEINVADIDDIVEGDRLEII